MARYFEVDVTIVRVITVLAVFLSGVGLLAYIILAVVVPLEGSKAAEPKDTVKENVEEMKETATELGREIQSTLAGEEGESEETSRVRHRRRNLFGIILVILGGLFLLANFNFFWWFNWGNLWPIAIVAIGLLIIISTRGRK